MKTLCRSILLVTVYVVSASAAERVKDIYESEESWAKAVQNKRMLKSPAFQYVKTDPNLPRVLLYGDSISMGYTPHVQQFLAGKVTVQRIPCNGGDTASGFDKLKQVGMEKGKWDLIHFNWGLHDLKYVDEKGRKVAVEKGRQLRSVADYKKNLEELVVILKSTGAKLIFATTTPVGPSNAGRVMGDARKFNKAAVEVMKKNGIIINDLYGLVFPKLKEYQRPNDVHYLPAGSLAMAKQVTMRIYSALFPQMITRMMGRRKRVQCANRLANLGKLALLYADDHRSWYPIANTDAPRAHESLHLLVECFEFARDPDLYVCPGSKQVPAKHDAKKDEPFVLTENNVSYAWRVNPLKTGKSARTILACDKSLENHNGEGIHVLRVDASVKWIPKEQLGEGGLEAFLKKHKLSR